MSAENEMCTTGAAVDVAIVGAGFSGLYMLHRVRQLGLTARVFEAGSGVGGTWFWNRYPGARCDVHSFDYQYSFSAELLNEWRWTERYPRQDEILRYLEYVADKFGLRDAIELNTRVTAAHFDDVTGQWMVDTDRAERVSANWVVMATGCLSATTLPDFEGLADFDGEWHHTGGWPEAGVDLAGKRVAVIGTGSSGIQVIPEIAEEAAELIVFQRTPNFSIPAFNRTLSADDIAAELAGFQERRRYSQESFLGLAFPVGTRGALEVTEDERRQEYETRWRQGGLALSGAFADILLDREANGTLVDFIHTKIQERVDDPDVAEKLTPRGYPVGAKRICLDNNYYETFNRDHVTLVDVSSNGIDRITPNGVLSGGIEYEVDVIVFATGFDAMTGAIQKVDICGRAGLALREKWRAGPKTLLGISVAGFPNLFLITGPGSPSVFSNMVVSIEQHVNWIADAISYVRAEGMTHIDPNESAETDWVDHVNEVASATLLPQANSWYLGANMPGKPRQFMPYVGGVGAYRHICDSVAEKGYDGFVLSRIDGGHPQRTESI